MWSLQLFVYIDFGNIYLPTIVPYNIGPGMKATRAITTSEKPNDSDLSSCFTHLNSENVHIISRLGIKEIKVKVKLLLTKFHSELLYLNFLVQSFFVTYGSNLLIPFYIPTHNKLFL